MVNLDELNLEGKNVLIRLDLNVSSRDPEKIAKEDRVVAVLPMIKYVTDRKGKAILMSHLGRPDGEIVPEHSLKPVAKALEIKLGKGVKMAPDCIGEGAESLIANMEGGDVVLLENLRFHKGEEANDPDFVQSLAKLGDIYINDAFGTAHREHASTYGVPELFIQEKKPVAAGLLMQKEIDMWSDVMEKGGPKYLCLGGKKLKEKIKALEKLSKEFDKVYIAGLVYNVVRAAQGRGVGASTVTEKDGKDYISKVKEFLPNLKNLVMPDYLMIAKLNEEGIFVEGKRIAESEEIPEDYAIVDCIYDGEKLEELKKANVAVCFGPFGVFEKKYGGFSEGTNNIAKAFSNVKAAVFAGGDSGLAYSGVEEAKFSTGGGVSITYLDKKELQCVKILKK